VAKFLVVPLLYSASVLPVFAGVLVATVLVEDTISSYLYEYDFEGDFTFYGNAAVMIALLVVACPVFGLLGWALYSMEGDSMPSVLDHLRHCAFLYISSVILSVVMVTSYREEVAAGYTDPILNTMPVLVTVSAILFDALILVWQRRHANYANSGESS